jgi:hypothetical protein
LRNVEVIAYTLSLLKAGYGIENLIYELSKEEEKNGIFKKIVRAIRKGRELKEILTLASAREKDALMREYFSLLARAVSEEGVDIENQLRDLMAFGYKKELDELKKSMKRFMTLSSALIIAALAFAITGALSAVIASLSLGPFGSMFAGVNLLAFFSIPIGLLVIFLILLLGWKSMVK